MRKALLTVALLMTAMAVARAADQGADVRGWQDFRWGMTRLETAATGLGPRDYSTTVDKQTAKQFGLTDYRITDTCVVSVTLSFQEDRLTGVNLSPIKSTAPWCVFAIPDGLRERYGEPFVQSEPSHAQGVHTRNYEWILPSTIIRVTVHTFSDPRLSLVQTRYFQRGSGPGGRL